MVRLPCEADSAGKTCDVEEARLRARMAYSPSDPPPRLGSLQCTACPPHSDWLGIKIVARLIVMKVRTRGSSSSWPRPCCPSGGTPGPRCGSAIPKCRGGTRSFGGRPTMFFGWPTSAGRMEPSSTISPSRTSSCAGRSHPRRAEHPRLQHGPLAGADLARSHPPHQHDRQAGRSAFVGDRQNRQRI